MCFRAGLELLGFEDKGKLDALLVSWDLFKPVDNTEDLVSCFLGVRRFHHALENYMLLKEGRMLDNLQGSLSCSGNEVYDRVEAVKERRRKEMLSTLLRPHIEESNCQACEGALVDRGRLKEVCNNMSGLVQCAEHLYQGFSRSYCKKRVTFAALANENHPLYHSCMLQTHLVNLSIQLFPGLQQEIDRGIETPFPPQAQTNHLLSLPPDVNDTAQAKRIFCSNLRVPDGDTLVHVDGHTRLTIRIPDLDAHEKGDSLLFTTDDGKTVVFDVGLEARRKLIGLMHEYQEAFLDMRWSKTDHFRREIREIWLRMTGDQPLRAVSQLMVKHGQALPYIDDEGANQFDSKRFDMKWLWSKTRSSEAGLCRFPREVVLNRCLQPFYLRKCRRDNTALPAAVPIDLHLCQRKAEVLLNCTELRSLEVSVVDTKKTWECITYAKQSTINNAGMGLFVEEREDAICKGGRIAFYGHLVSEEPADTTAMTYVITIHARELKHCDASPASSGALGRFSNMLIPMEALVDLIKTSATMGDDLSQVNRICADAANAKFSPEENHLFIVAKQDLDLRRGDTEIFVDYGFSSYWFGEIFTNPEVFLESSPLLSTAIVFAICDQRSKMTLLRRRSLSRKDPSDFQHLLRHPSYSEDFIRGALSAKRR